MMMEAIRSPKRLFLQEPHGVTSQKTAFFMDNCKFDLTMMNGAANKNKQGNKAISELYRLSDLRGRRSSADFCG
jgi:hypothetical protein